MWNKKIITYKLLQEDAYAIKAVIDVTHRLRLSSDVENFNYSLKAHIGIAEIGESIVISGLDFYIDSYVE